MRIIARVSFGKHEPPQPGPGLQELVADALVVAHAEHDVVDVGADGFAHRGDRVDERELGGEERVAGVLDGLGRRRVGDHERRGHADVERGDADGGALVVAADHDAIGLEEVGDRRALPQELGVRHDGDVAATERLLDEPGRTDRHGRLVDDDGARRAGCGAISRPRPRCSSCRPSRRRPGASGTQR